MMAAQAQSSFKLGGPYAWFVVFMLCLASIMSYVDRQIINLLVEPIKADLGINDTQIGLLQGFSFVLIYAVAAIPVAWVADFGRRTTVIIIGIVCWSMATFFCGLATTFIMLFIARSLVGLGEVTLTPSGYSLIGDYFPKERVGLAISLFTGTGFFGSGLAYIIGGRVVEALSDHGAYTLPLIGAVQPWQLVFMIVSIPGLLLAALFFLVKEPPRQSVVEVDAMAEKRASFVALLNHIKNNARLFAGLFFGFALMASATYAIVNWVPTFLARVHGWTPGQIGDWFGPVLMFSSTLGVFTGGIIASTLMSRGVASANMLVAIAAGLIAIIFAILFPLAGSGEMALFLLIPTLFFAAMPFGCGTATLPLVTPNRLRAQVVAVYLLVANLLGLTLGPTGVGLLTDYVFKDPAMINVALAIAAPSLLFAGALVAMTAVAPYRKVIQASDT
ncbi:MAG: MFS transporter [Henriciella sp.]